MIWLDTSALIRLFDVGGTPVDPLTAPLLGYVTHFAGRGTRVATSTLSIAELMYDLRSNVPPETLLAELKKMLDIVPFEEPDALLTASIYRGIILPRKAQAVSAAGGRQCLKVDCMIVASAAIHGATQLLGKDGDLSSICTGLSVLGISGLAYHPLDMLAIPPDDPAKGSMPNLFPEAADDGADD